MQLRPVGADGPKPCQHLKTPVMVLLAHPGAIAISLRDDLIARNRSPTTVIKFKPLDRRIFLQNVEHCRNKFKGVMQSAIEPHAA